MKNFLFEQYGYYPKNLIDNEFILDNWKFKLLETDLSQEALIDIEKYIDGINKTFNKGPFIIKNKTGGYISSFSEKNYTLVSVYDANMSFLDLENFHKLFYKSDEYVELDKILVTWKERIDKIEKNLNSTLRMDDVYYKDSFEISIFVIGLGINALQYLSDIIHNYDSKLYGVSIVHKRLKNLNSFDLLNPFNFIVEHPLKDYFLLYQNDFIKFDEFKSYILNYTLDSISASFVMARLLYRVDVFDFLEEEKDLIEGNRKINFSIERELDKIKKVYDLLKNTYFIRPLDWLD